MVIMLGLCWDLVMQHNSSQWGLLFLFCRVAAALMCSWIGRYQPCAWLAAQACNLYNLNL